ncbi:chromosomal replication initiator protein DnaA [Limisalsivibrio acetivorans]|uniref:chromosomal replication initiator protein DnaA n=1 Tax=Limisalsivibrio acetivorans TaxID=1304888 RepID=UPI0003B5E8F5|nr:chromosomal replication initiator protein DnaA [Limisalsivibrio acetivorans]
MEDAKIWEEVLKEAKKHCSDEVVSTWIKPLKIVEVRGDLITLQAPNRFYKGWVEEKYMDTMRKIFNEGLSIDADVRIVVAEGKKRTPAAVEEVQPNGVTEQPYYSNNTGLNRENTFENFVAGSSNQFSHAACLAVSEGHFQMYNPLFIYGGVGLGKTHLMQAAGNRILERFPKMKVLYITSETFTNEMINSLRSKKMDEFRNKYRNIDMLLFDDVQFLAGKQRSTEEFFHTFNTLYDMHKQIILTSDKTPGEIPEMEERLISRFAWGLIADIQTPTAEEKTAIMMKRADMMNLRLPEEVALFIAENIKTENIRELIGALVRLSAYASFHNEPLSIDLARKSLDRFLVKKDRMVTQDDIIKAVTEYFNVKLADLKSKKRTRSVSVPRQLSMYLLRDKLSMSLQEVGDLFGGRDHSTVLHAVQTIEKKVRDDKEIQSIVESIEKTLYS